MEYKVIHKEFGGQLVKEKENECMNRKVMEMVMFMTRQFDYYCGLDDEVNTEKMKNMDAQDRDDFIINFVEMAIEDNVEDWQKFLIDNIKESFPIEQKYEYVEVEVTRVRKILEKATIGIAVKKTDELGEKKAEQWVELNIDGDTDLDWEVEDEEYEIENEIKIENSWVTDTDTLDEIESCNEVYETIE